ncbi:MAG: PIN domain nuclease [Planctomycetes bacterium]|nr:PIN domain nuclease [Planctomycetota bacterium]
MILVDTAVWVDYFNMKPTPYAARLGRAMDEEEDLGIAPVIVAEVLQGFRDETRFEAARVALLALPVVDMGLAGYVSAARIYRTLRRKGITVRSTVDCVIAASALRAGATLLSPDVDFHLIAEHFPLRLVGVR